MGNNRFQAIVLVAIIVLPLAIFFLFKTTSTAYFDTLPYQYSIQNGDTLYHELPDFSFTDQDGNPFTRDSLRDKVCLMSFFRGDVAGEKPVTKLLFAHLEKFYENTERAKIVKVVSVTFDTTLSLKSFSDSLQYDTDRWHFVQGSRDAVFELGLESFRLPEFKARMRDSTAFTANSVVLIDKSGKVRKYYDGIYLYDMVRVLAEDLRALLTIEYKDDFIGKEDESKAN